MLQLTIQEIVAIFKRQTYSMPTTHELIRFQVGEDEFTCVVCGTVCIAYHMRNVGQFIVCEPCAIKTIQALDAAQTKIPFRSFYLRRTLEQAKALPDDPDRSCRRMKREERIVHQCRSGVGGALVPDEDVLEEQTEDTNAVPLVDALGTELPPPLPPSATVVEDRVEVVQPETESVGADADGTIAYAAVTYAIDGEPGVELPSCEKILHAASITALYELKFQLDAANTELHQRYDEGALKFLGIYRRLGELYVLWKERLRKVDFQEFLRVQEVREERKARRGASRLATM